MFDPHMVASFPIDMGQASSAEKSLLPISVGLKLLFCACLAVSFQGPSDFSFQFLAEDDH